MKGNRWGIAPTANGYEVIDRITGQVWTFETYEDADAKLERLRTADPNGGWM